MTDPYTDPDLTAQTEAEPSLRMRRMHYQPCVNNRDRHQELGLWWWGGVADPPPQASATELKFSSSAEQSNPPQYGRTPQQAKSFPGFKETC